MTPRLSWFLLGCLVTAVPALLFYQERGPVASGMRWATGSLAADVARDMAIIDAAVHASIDPAQSPAPELTERAIFALKQSSKSIKAIQDLAAARPTDVDGSATSAGLLWIVGLVGFATRAKRLDGPSLPPLPVVGSRSGA